MRKSLKQLSNLFFKKASALAPDSFGTTTFFGCAAVRGSYVLPLNYNTLPANVQQDLQITYDIEEKKIFELKNVFISPEGIIFKNLKIFVPSLASTLLLNLIGYSFLARQFMGFRKPFVKFDKPVIVAHDQWSQNYYHWVIDLLSKLLLPGVEMRKCILLVPEYSADFMMPTLEALGYANFYKIKDNSIIQAKTVFLPDRTAVGNLQNPPLLATLRDRLIEALHPRSSQPTRRVYVSRSKSPKRRLLNEQKVVEMLKKYEFEHVYFEQLAFLQQIELMQQTKVLIGVHGANLVNTLFLQKDSIVVELMNAEFTNLVYYKMASTLELPYYLLACTPDPVSADRNDGTIFTKNDVDIEVNLAELAEVLKKIFSD